MWQPTCSCMRFCWNTKLRISTAAHRHCTYCYRFTDCNLKLAYSVYNSIMRLVFLYIFTTLQKDVSNLKLGGIYAGGIFKVLQYKHTERQMCTHPQPCIYMYIYTSWVGSGHENTTIILQYSAVCSSNMNNHNYMHECICV